MSFAYAYRGCSHGVPLKGSLPAMYFGSGECPYFDENGLPYHPHFRRGKEKMKEYLSIRELSLSPTVSEILLAVENIYHELKSTENFKGFFNGGTKGGMRPAYPYIESFYEDMRYFIIEDTEMKMTVIAAYAELEGK